MVSQTTTAKSELEEEFTQALIEGYRQVGEKTGYWARRYLGALKRKGGLATARDMIKPRNQQQRSGLDKLIEAGEEGLTIEAAMLGRFKSLFTAEELAIAAERLGKFGEAALAYKASKENLFPDELAPGSYPEGVKKTVRVNAYERSQKARNDCVKHHGYRCTACQVLLADIYGDLAKSFIHVHHLTPLYTIDEAYRVNGVNDLRPVCPNCHAMLHRKSEVVLTIDQLREIISTQRKQLK